MTALESAWRWSVKPQQRARVLRELDRLIAELGQALMIVSDNGCGLTSNYERVKTET